MDDVNGASIMLDVVPGACGGDGNGRRGERGGEVSPPAKRGLFSASDLPKVDDGGSGVDRLSVAVFVSSAARLARSAMLIGAKPDRARTRRTTSRGSSSSASRTACWARLARLILRARRALTFRRAFGVGSSRDFVGEGERDASGRGDIFGEALAAGGVDRASRACRAASPPGSRFGGEDEAVRVGEAGAAEEFERSDEPEESWAKMLRAERRCEGNAGSALSAGSLAASASAL